MTSDLGIGPPDFVGVGTQRSGTTWWFRNLVRRRGIRAARTRRKELHFFDKFGVREFTDADVARYHELFPRVPGQISGEWTPRYMRDPWTPRLLRRAAPDAKLLVLLRDPIERYRSGVQHEVTRSLARRPALRATDAVERGRYAVQLQRLRAYFDPAQILVLQYERCRLEPVRQFRRTLRFLGVDASRRPRRLKRPRGTTMAARKEPLWPDLQQALRTALEPDVLELAELVPDLELELWPNFADLVSSRAAGRTRPRAGGR